MPGTPATDSRNRIRYKRKRRGGDDWALKTIQMLPYTYIHALSIIHSQACFPHLLYCKIGFSLLCRRLECRFWRGMSIKSNEVEAFPERFYKTGSKFVGERIGFVMGYPNSTDLFFRVNRMVKHPVFHCAWFICRSAWWYSRNFRGVFCKQATPPMRWYHFTNWHIPNSLSSTTAAWLVLLFDALDVAVMVAYALLRKIIGLRLAIRVPKPITPLPVNVPASMQNRLA